MKVTATGVSCLAAFLGIALAVSPMAKAHPGSPPVAAADGESGGCGGASKDGGKAEPTGTGT